MSPTQSDRQVIISRSLLYLPQFVVIAVLTFMFLIRLKIAYSLVILHVKHYFIITKNSKELSDSTLLSVREYTQMSSEVLPRRQLLVHMSRQRTSMPGVTLYSSGCFYLSNGLCFK